MQCRDRMGRTVRTGWMEGLCRDTDMLARQDGLGGCQAARLGRTRQSKGRVAGPRHGAPPGAGWLSEDLVCRMDALVYQVIHRVTGLESSVTGVPRLNPSYGESANRLLLLVLGRPCLDSTGACTMFLLLLSAVYRRDCVEETQTRF